MIDSRQNIIHKDVKRCAEAKIPIEFSTYKIKPELALDMIMQDIARGIRFDWLGRSRVIRPQYQAV